MLKSSTIIFLVVLTFFITLGLAISLQSVFGLNIAGTLTGPLNLGNQNITNLAAPRPLESQDAATKGYVDSVTSSGMPAGAVMHFNLVACPSGWTALAGAQGRYLVGLPAGGTLAGTVGTALTNTENRPVGQHSHTVFDPGHVHTFWIINPGFTGPNQWHGESNTSKANHSTAASFTGITINSTGTVAGTNAPYMQLLVCQKD